MHNIYIVQINPYVNSCITLQYPCQSTAIQYVSTNAVSSRSWNTETIYIIFLAVFQYVEFIPIWTLLPTAVTCRVMEKHNNNNNNKTQSLFPPLIPSLPRSLALTPLAAILIWCWKLVACNCAIPLLILCTTLSNMFLFFLVLRIRCFSSFSLNHPSPCLLSDCPILFSTSSVNLLLILSSAYIT